MLIYEHDGYLEVEAQEIKQLCRSVVALSFGEAQCDPFELHAVLCVSSDLAEPRCRAAFFAKALKRSLVFAVKGSESLSAWQHGQEVLAQLGFQLEDVNLKLSPAMLEVVLRDVPGLASPAEARKQRQEKALLLAELKKALDEDPDSAPGKKAALKLGSEKRLGERVQELRQLLESLLVPAEGAAADLRALVSQVNELNARLEAAELLAETERSRREMSESITAAAEKRIQELEEVLVDVETKSAQSLKDKRKITKLQGQVKDLGGELVSAEQAMAKELAKQEQLIADIEDAHERITALEVDIQAAEQSLADREARLAGELAAKAQAEKRLEDAELRVAALQQELAQVKEKALHDADAIEALEESKVQLTEVQRALQDALDRNQALDKELAATAGRCEDLTAKLEQAEDATLARTRVEERTAALAEQHDEAVRELAVLRKEYDRECALRARLDKAAAADEQRIEALQESLARAAEASAAGSVDEKLSLESDRELASLRAALQEQTQRCMHEKQLRDESEAALQEAHELIGSLEKALRKTGQAESGGFSVGPAPVEDSLKLLELEEQLKTQGLRLDDALAKHDALATALAAAEKKLAERSDPAPQRQEDRKARRIPEPVVAAETIAAPRPKSSKPLPHELRPAPKKGAFFRPDWDLPGLPCQSPAQVYKAWESAFNVQIALEGYTSQYCMAFLVVLRIETQKRLYMLYRLKQDKHTLVCVPAKTPVDEASLQKALQEGLKFLKLSGFEMEEMAVENVDRTLGSYFLQG